MQCVLIDFAVYFCSNALLRLIRPFIFIALSSLSAMHSRSVWLTASELSENTSNDGKPRHCRHIMCSLHGRWNATRSLTAVRSVCLCLLTFVRIDLDSVRFLILSYCHYLSHFLPFC